jgi:hypothetical protein
MTRRKSNRDPSDSPQARERVDEDDRDHRAFRNRSRSANDDPGDHARRSGQWDEERGPVPDDERLP